MEINKSPEQSRVEGMIALAEQISDIATGTATVYGIGFKGHLDVKAIKEQSMVLYETEYVTNADILLGTPQK